MAERAARSAAGRRPHHFGWPDGGEDYIINSKNESVTILVSPDTHLPMEKRFSVRDPRSRKRNRNPEAEATIYGNWKVIQGINTPRILLTRRNGETIYQELFLNITYNTHPAETLLDPLVAKINPIKAD